MKLRALCIAVPLFLLSSCDPGVDFGYAQDFAQPIDEQCVERALRSVAPEVKRDSYVSEGARGFPRGTEVTQFFYPDPIFYYGYSLDIARLPNGKTHYVHVWSKLGTDVPAEERAKVLLLLNRANSAVARQCGLSFVGSQPEIGRG